MRGWEILLVIRVVVRLSQKRQGREQRDLERINLDRYADGSVR